MQGNRIQSGLKSGNNPIFHFSDHIGIKLETNTRKIDGKSPNIWRLDNTFLNNRWVKEEVS